MPRMELSIEQRERLKQASRRSFFSGAFLVVVSIALIVQGHQLAGWMLLGFFALMTAVAHFALTRAKSKGLGIEHGQRKQ